MTHRTNLAELSRKLRDLPGSMAHEEVAVPGRRKYDAGQQVRDAAVLVLLYPDTDQDHMILIEREVHQHDRHSGQISFPGGKYEECDQSYEDCALREAEEEIGISSQQVHIAGRLSSLYIPVSGFQVYPVVGYCSALPSLVPQPGEVRQILKVPLTQIMDVNAIRTGDHQVLPGLTIEGIRYFDHQGHVIWGATAMIINELRVVLRY